MTDFIGNGVPVAREGSTLVNTWNTILVPFIIRELTKEVGTVDSTTQQDVWLPLANEFVQADLASIAPKTRVLLPADLTLVDGVVLLPASTIAVKNVLINDYPINRSSRVALDSSRPGWQTVAGSSATHYFVEGHQLYTYPVLSSLESLKITVEGQLPLFATTGTENPTDWFPSGFNLLPAYYVLSSLPWDVDHAAQVSRYQRNAAKLERMQARMADVMDNLSLEDFEF